MRLFLFLLLFVSGTYAQNILMIGAGGVTPHITHSKKYYCNQWNDTGIIFNRTYYLRVGRDAHSITFMEGEDSICSSITGLFYGYKFSRRVYFDWGFVVGGYTFKQENWDANSDNTPPGFDKVDLFSTEILGFEFVPLIGVELTIHLIKTSSFSLVVNNILTPIITNHSLAAEFRF